MARVVIVEDEMLVRLGLKSIIETDRELTVSATFATAEEAEKYLKNTKADVLITDVRLPGMDGLELIRRVKENDSELTVVVLSCYEDFNYARTALKFGAARYLLKHELNEEELPQLIRELIGSTSRKNIRSSPQEILQSTLKGMLGGSRILTFCFRGYEESTNASSQELNLDMLTEIIGSALAEHELGKCLVWKEQTILGVLPEGKNICGRFQIAFREISDSMELFIDKNCFAGISDPFSDSENFEKYIEQAVRRSRQSFYCETSTAFFSDISDAVRCPALHFDGTDSFTGKWLEKINGDIDSFFFSCRHDHPTSEHIKETVVRFLHAMFAHSEQYYNMKPEEVFPSDAMPGYQMVSRFESLEALRVWLKEVMRQTAQYVGSQESLTVNIRSYIEKNYSNCELRQSDAAEFFHMSSPYFSQYFKEHFGVNYVQYLNEMRINKAKILLRTTNDSTESIAEKVGIDNVNYFFRLFKKLEGHTVKDYRRKNCEQK